MTGPNPNMHKGWQNIDYSSNCKGVNLGLAEPYFQVFALVEEHIYDYPFI